MTAHAYPANWQIAADFDPNDHLIQLKGRDYLNVQSRLLWFIRDQRTLIAQGLATMPYAVHSELVDLDRDSGYAHYKTYVRDVLGNEATMYGSETKADFADYAEKASTKSLGRALLALGYGTAFAPEMDEGARVVDAPVQRQPEQSEPKPLPMRKPKTLKERWSELQLRAVQRGVIKTQQDWEDSLCEVLGKNVTDTSKLTAVDYNKMLAYFAREIAKRDKQQQPTDLAATTWKGGA